jgi:hypothetical protein
MHPHGRAVAVTLLSLALLVACAKETATPPTTSAPPSPAAAESFSGTDKNLSAAQLEALVGPVALYPDDLLALVLPASTQPQQVVDAKRFLEQRKTNASLEPPKTWDPSVIALLNYPDALNRMSADFTWLQQLGTSVVDQQAAVMDAVQSFRRKVLEAGNLKSDDKQNISVKPGGAGASQVVVIEPASPQAIYVPTYQPTSVTYAASPDYVYPYYWSAPYPYYYNPAATFYMGTFVGTSIGFGCSWHDHDIYRGDINVENVNVNNINRERANARTESAQNSNLANEIRQNPENVWRPDPAAVSRTQASGSSAAAARGATARANLNTAAASGAFSGVNRGAVASAYSARGARSMGGGFRGGRR